jgi:hypothetical protein
VSDVGVCCGVFGFVSGGGDGEWVWGWRWRLGMGMGMGWWGRLGL